MRIIYKRKYDLTNPCVAKLWFGEKYLVLKSSDIATAARQLVDSFRTGDLPGEGLKVFVTRRLQMELRQTAESSNKCVVEIMLSSTKGEALLAIEQVLLNQRDKACINRNRIPARPKWINEYMTPAPLVTGLFKVKGRHRAAPAVVKIWIGELFFIWKCKDIQEFPAKFSTSMQANIRNNDERSFGVLNPLVVYMRRVPGVQGLIEVVFKGELSRSGVKKILAVEKKLLDKFSRTPHCLNRSVVPYLPAWIHELQGSTKNKTA
jgi:hypothetical protein